MESWAVVKESTKLKMPWNLLIGKARIKSHKKTNTFYGSQHNSLGGKRAHCTVMD